MPKRGVAGLENCLEGQLAGGKVQDWKCTSRSQHGSGVKKLVLEAVPDLLIIKLKKFRKVENSVEKIHKRMKFSMAKAVIGGRKYKLKGDTYSQSPMSGH